ncbi:MAG: hypothetical protein EAY75_18350 [Bacteroidetes bacterium]|nr:MAG: hypothetical protein EAY75_18350 [Bacteroidota bacterium]
MRFLFILILTGYYSALNAQQAPIAIVSANGATKLVNTLDEAAQQAQTNDIIYLPAGNLPGQSTTFFTKRVTVIGVGHHPDSASANGKTFITGNIGFSFGGAEGSVLDGVHIAGLVYLSANCKVYRVNAGTLYLSSGWPAGDNLIVEQCILRNFYAYESAITNSKVRNSVITNVFTTNVSTTTFENCILLVSQSGSSPYPLEQAYECTFRNCIFPNMTSWNSSPCNSFFYNNIMAASELPVLSNAGNASRNILGQSPSVTFVQQSGLVYQYDQNYRLKPGSPGINAGTDGKDIGIYGGPSPYKDGAVPPNPSIRVSQIDSETNLNGILRVRFNVRVN